MSLLNFFTIKLKFYIFLIHLDERRLKIKKKYLIWIKFYWKRKKISPKTSKKLFLSLYRLCCGIWLLSSTYSNRCGRKVHIVSVLKKLNLNIYKLKFTYKHKSFFWIIIIVSCHIWHESIKYKEMFDRLMVKMRRTKIRLKFIFNETLTNCAVVHKVLNEKK